MLETRYCQTERDLDQENGNIQMLQLPENKDEITADYSVRGTLALSLYRASLMRHTSGTQR